MHNSQSLFKKSVLHAALGCMLFTVSINSSNAYTSIWSVVGTNTDIVAIDCYDCEEDIGIIFACKGNGLPAEVTVHTAATMHGQSGSQSPITFLIDGKKFTYTANTVNYEAIGFTPVLQIFPNDPIISTLQSGKNAEIIFNEQISVLKLNGSRSAISTFATHCGWSEVGFQDNLTRQADAPTTSLQIQSSERPSDQSTELQYSQTVFTRVPAMPDANGAFWFTGDGFGGASPKNLRFGVPETDAIALFASCEDFSANNIELEIYTSFGDVGADIPVTAEFQLSTNKVIFAGKTFIQGEEYAGTRFTIPKDSSLWTEIATSTEVYFGIQGQPMVQVNGAAGRPALLEFNNLCKQ